MTNLAVDSLRRLLEFLDTQPSGSLSPGAEQEAKGFLAARWDASIRCGMALLEFGE